ncbi:DUF1302 domain-containing protein [Amphritea sp. HPY]|uniref:DUF1302 domain-containing protein n=1 Tax=Amphritea sp. HPY TaxID=3421652 RepID=UPI003D7CEFDA
MNQLAMAIRKTVRQKHLRILSSGLIVAGLALGASSAHALSFELENGVTIDWDTTLKYDAQWRMEDQDKTLLETSLSAGNGFLRDDGNLNFDKHDMTQNRVSFSTEADINAGNYGAFLRARGWYDEVYDDDSLAAANFQQDGIDQHKSEIEMLDAFIYGDIEIGERSLNLRIGDQVVSWGESLALYGGISSAQGPIDATKANSPGVDLKEIFLPVGQVYGEMDLSDTLSVGAYYQYEWDESRVDAPGTYFSPLDVYGQGAVGDSSALGIVTEITPDSDSYGIALRYVAEELNSTEFGLYYLRYNDFIPTIQLTGDGTPYPSVTLEHFNDINLLGLSFGTVIGDTNISGEISYRDGQPVQVGDGPFFYFTEAETVQAQASWLHLFGATPFADNLTFIGEVGYNRVIGIDDDALGSALAITTGASGGPLSQENIDNVLNNDQEAASALLRLKADYYSVAPGLDMSVTGTYRNDFYGTSSVLFTFTEGREDLALNLDFTYLDKHTFGASYVAFLTDPEDIVAGGDPIEFAHHTADRDYASLYYKYSF